MYLFKSKNRLVTTQRYTFAPIGLVFAVLFAGGCYYDSEEFLYGIENCDLSAEISYESYIAPLLNENCNMCHASDIALGGIILDGYDAVKEVADNGKLYGAISHSNGYSPMPKNAGKFDDCTIAHIQKWINEGTLNN